MTRYLEKPPIKKHLHKAVSKISNTSNVNRAAGLIIIVAITLIGAQYLFGVHAQSPYVVSDAANGTLNSNASRVTDSSAASGSAVQFGSAPVSANTYYVSPSGNDSNSGSSTSPWLTIQKAINTVPANSTVDLETGTYGSFTANKANITITAAPSASPIVQGATGEESVVLVSASNVTLSNFTVTGCVPASTPPNDDFEDDGSADIRTVSVNNITMNNMTISNSHGTNQYGLPFGCFGINLDGSNEVTISNSNISQTGTGIFVNGGAQSDLITNNQVYDNAYEIRDTPTSVNANDDFGSDGIAFDGGAGYGSIGTPGPVASDNNLYGNLGPSADYTIDGGGFEIFEASNITMEDNTISNNNGILETGTGGTGCNNNQFLNNTASGRPSNVAYSANTASPGIILRCAADMVISGNTFTNLDWWVFWIGNDGSFAAAINGISITNNTVSQATDTIYDEYSSLSGLGITINDNKIHSGGSNFAELPNGNYVSNLASWTSTTGFDANSTTF